MPRADRYRAVGTFGDIIGIYERNEMGTMAGRNSSRKLSVSKLKAIDELFQSKDWKIEFYGSMKNSQYQRFCERMAIFNEADQQFFLDMAACFHQILINDYLTHIWMAYSIIPNKILDEADKIIFSPLLEILSDGSRKNNSTKSSNALLYHMKGDKYDNANHNQKFEFMEDARKIKSKFTRKSVLIFIDDFIGSGKTAVDTVKSYRNFIPLLNSNNCIITSIVCQQAGQQTILEETQCRVEAKFIYNKAISDKFSGAILEAKLKQMSGMEKNVSKDIMEKGLHLGFEQTEALVCFQARSPNNTLPVFWFETETKMAPFPRARIFKSNQYE
ncbi:MAG TPA: hypothetical protein VK658_04075 [Chryseolinea sp.]|nr:hypothetical protein [Chryseolinea sp.]